MKLLSQVLVITALQLAGSSTALAAWPNDKPINFLIPYAAGGATDVQARFLAEKLGHKIKQSVIPINKPGAGTTIATAELLRNGADGYTLLMGSITSHGIAPTLYRDTVKYDAVKDFAPVAQVTSIPNVLLVNPKLKIDSVDALIAYARKKPGGLNYASAGYGSSTHMAAVLFQKRLNLDMTHVPYSGGAQAITSLIAGDVDIYFDQISTALPFIKSHKVKALAITSAKASDSAPDIKPIRLASTAPELKDFEMSAWWGIYAKAGTSPPIVTTLNKALNEVLTENKEFFAQNEITREGGSPEELNKLTTEELNRWRPIILEMGMKPN